MGYWLKNIGKCTLSFPLITKGIKLKVPLILLWLKIINNVYYNWNN